MSDPDRFINKYTPGGPGIRRRNGTFLYSLKVLYEGFLGEGRFERNLTKYTIPEYKINTDVFYCTVEQLRSHETAQAADRRSHITKLISLKSRSHK